MSPERKFRQKYGGEGEAPMAAHRRPHAQREMGPASLPTPLSPAVGSVRNAYRLALSAVRPGSSGSCARRSRRCRIIGKPGLIRRPVPCSTSIRTGSSVLLLQAAPSTNPKTVEGPSAAGLFSGHPTMGWCGIDSPGNDLPQKAILLPFLLHSGASPSRRSLLSGPLFRSAGDRPEVPWFRFRYVEDATSQRVGQECRVRLIHFRTKCQWTAVDKSTP